MAHHRDPSGDALKSAKAFVKMIEFFRTHGTGEFVKRYPDYLGAEGYDYIVRKAHELAEQCEGFDEQGQGRRRVNRAAA